MKKPYEKNVFTEDWQQKLKEFEHTSDGAIHYTRAIIQDEHGKYICLFDKRFGHYQLPGGKVDTGENMEEALIREIYEET